MSLSSPPSSPPVSCAELRAGAAALADDALPVPLAEAMRRHLESCSACRARVEHERAFLARLHRVRDRERAPSALRARIAAALDRRGRPAS